MHDIVSPQPAEQAAAPEAQVPSPPAASQPAVERFQFTGKTGEYFGIWIVNLFLTIVTLGIYSAWAKVRKKRYFYANTIIDGAGQRTRVSLAEGGWRNRHPISPL